MTFQQHKYVNPYIDISFVSHLIYASNYKTFSLKLLDHSSGQMFYKNNFVKLWPNNFLTRFHIYINSDTFEIIYDQYSYKTDWKQHKTSQHQ